MTGIELVVAILIGTGLGYLGDRYLNTFPYLMVIGFVLGAITGFRNAFRLISRSEKQDQNKRRTHNSGK